MASGSPLACSSWPLSTGQGGVFGSSSHGPAVSVFTDGGEGSASIPGSTATALSADWTPIPREHSWGRDDPKKFHPLSWSFNFRDTTHRWWPGKRTSVGGRVQLTGAWRQPQAPGPPAPRTLSCWAGAGAELSGLVSPLGRANPATGYFCGAPGLESGAGPPPRAARESPVRKVRAPPAGAGPNPGPRPDLEPEADTAAAAPSGSG